jgi:hypothetical protein
MAVRRRGSIPFSVGIQQKKESETTLLNSMQSVGESNPCYQDENLAS